MNRYPAWKYALLALALVVGLVYTLPNLFGEAPAVQVSGAKSTVKVDAAMVPRIEEILKSAKLAPDFVQYENNSVKARFGDLDQQRLARDAIAAALNPDAADPSYIVALPSEDPIAKVVRRTSWRRTTPLRLCWSAASWSGPARRTASGML